MLGVWWVGGWSGHSESWIPAPVITQRTDSTGDHGSPVRSLGCGGYSTHPQPAGSLTYLLLPFGVEKGTGYGEVHGSLIVLPGGRCDNP